VRRKTKSRSLSSRHFPHLVNTAAFIDTVGFSIDGKLADAYEQELIESKDTGILHPGVVYSRCIFARAWLTGNPVTIHHGRVKKFRNVALLKFTIRSEKVPVTGAQTILLIRKVAARNSKPSASYVEVTFDLSGVEFESIRRRVFHRAHGVRLLQDEKGRQTLYIGSPKSSWQIRIYQKTETVVRIEFVFRRSFLSRHGINRPEEIALLQRLNIWSFFSLRRFSRTQAKQLMRKSHKSKLRKLLAVWMRSNRPSEDLISTLRRNRIDPRRVFRKTSLQEMLERMQRRLVW
jgi:hypothetical protein